MIVFMITMMTIAIPHITQARSIQFSPGTVKHLLPTADVCTILNWLWYVMFSSKLPHLGQKPLEAFGLNGFCRICELFICAALATEGMKERRKEGRKEGRKEETEGVCSSIEGGS